MPECANVCFVEPCEFYYFSRFYDEFVQKLRWVIYSARVQVISNQRLFVSKNFSFCWIEERAQGRKKRDGNVGKNTHQRRLRKISQLEFISENIL